MGLCLMKSQHGFIPRCFPFILLLISLLNISLASISNYFPAYPKCMNHTKEQLSSIATLPHIQQKVQVTRALEIIKSGIQHSRWLLQDNLRIKHFAELHKVTVFNVRETFFNADNKFHNSTGYIVIHRSLETYILQQANTASQTQILYATVVIIK